MEEDPFEIHTQFLDLLKQNLSARMIQKIGTFAYEHKIYYEGLFQGLLDTLKNVRLLYIVKPFKKTKHFLCGRLFVQKRF